MSAPPKGTSRVRVYLPTTLPGLAGILAVGAAGPAPHTAYAVTPTLRESYASDDSEELEYAAMRDAARASLRLLAELLAARPDAPARRVVLAADVSDRAVIPAATLGGAAVRLAVTVPVRDIAAGLIDDAAAAADVRAVVDALPAADAGDPDAASRVDEAEAHELQWWATQELPDLAR